MFREPLNLVLPFIDDGMLSDALDTIINMYDDGASKYGLEDGIPTLIEIGCVTHDKRQRAHEIKIVTNDKIFTQPKIARDVFAKIANDLVDSGSIPFCVFVVAYAWNTDQHKIIIAGRTSDGRTRSANVYVARMDWVGWYIEKIETEVDKPESHALTVLKYIDHLYSTARVRKSYVERNAILKTSRN